MTYNEFEDTDEPVEFNGCNHLAGAVVLLVLALSLLAVCGAGALMWWAAYLLTR